VKINRSPNTLNIYYIWYFSLWLSYVTHTILYFQTNLHFLQWRYTVVRKWRHCRTRTESTRWRRSKVVRWRHHYVTEEVNSAAGVSGWHASARLIGHGCVGRRVFGLCRGVHLEDTVTDGWFDPLLTVAISRCARLLQLANCVRRCYTLTGARRLAVASGGVSPVGFLRGLRLAWFIALRLVVICRSHIPEKNIVCLFI